MRIDVAEVPTGASQKQARRTVAAIICAVFRDNTEKYTAFELSNRSVSPLYYGQHFNMLLRFQTLKIIQLHVTSFTFSFRSRQLRDCWDKVFVSLLLRIRER